MSISSTNTISLPSNHSWFGVKKEEEENDKMEMNSSEYAQRAHHINTACKCKSNSIWNQLASTNTTTTTSEKDGDENHTNSLWDTYESNCYYKSNLCIIARRSFSLSLDST